ncbi:MAG: hypothetical protein JSS61_04895 [Verrucomicrobia bacterium]|nr:hypothetical protein [Verrucomicrobiota bacterium]
MRIVLSLLFLCTSAYADPISYFLPPSQWQIAPPEKLSSRVKMAFMKKTSSGLCPSINLAVERTDATLGEYLKAVKETYERDRNKHWRALGKVKTAAGLAQLTEVDLPSEWGPVRILQQIFLKEGHAYILTAAALREEFAEHYKEIQTSFRSFTLTNDLLSTIPELQRRSLLKEKQEHLLLAALDDSFDEENFQKECWLPFQEMILSQFSDMGPFWQTLILKTSRSALIDANPETFTR